MRYSVAAANIRHWRGIYRQSSNPERVMVHAVVRLQAHAGTWKQRADKAEQRIAELEEVLAYIDAHAPLADATCNQPGITLSEAARRAIKEAQP